MSQNYKILDTSEPSKMMTEKKIWDGERSN